MKVSLTVVKGPQLGRVMDFTDPRSFIIGRAEDADFCLPNDDLYVSRRHVFLEICPPACRLRDLGTAGSGSTNPPKLNDRVVTDATELAHGDVLELGYTQLKVSINAEAARKTTKCRGCGATIELMAAERDPEQCEACHERAQQARVQKHAAALEARCFRCGCNLSKQANSDGKAAALSGSVVYCCETCVPKRDETGGSVVGAYQVVHRLGEGGMGAVNLVYQRATARLLALKQMKDLKDPLLVKRFEREMRLMKSFAHANVVRCLETGIDGHGAPFVVSEFVPGGDLESAVGQAGGRLAPDVATAIVLRLLDGVEYLHGQKILHRDIKPQNVLMLNEASARGALGERSVPKITDFGLAVCYGRAGGTRLTKARTGMGTLMYMSPEQVRDAGNVREPADLYSVGVVLYYLLTGSYTFDFPTPQDIRELQRQRPSVKRPHEALQVIMQLNRIRHPFNIILGEEPTPIRKRAANLPARLADAADKAVRKDPRQRFQSAAEFKAALRDVR